MIKARISGFIKNNENKIKDLGVKLIIVAIVVFIATILIFFNAASDSKKGQTNFVDYDYAKETYKPQETIIQGEKVTQEQYAEDENIVNKFLDLCNSGKIEDAYSLLSEECKAELYPTLEEFKEYYYNNIFTKKREYNIQSWISNSKFTIYKIRYPNSMLSTGTYNEKDVYEDYITLNKDSKNEKISIGGFIFSKKYNVTTKTNELEATIVSKKTYISEEVYEINIKNNTKKTILLDNLQKSKTITLIADETKYAAVTNTMFDMYLRINAGETRKITIRFKKNFSSSNSSEYIEFSNIIKDYDKYKENKKEYKDITNIRIKLED